MTPDEVRAIVRHGAPGDHGMTLHGDPGHSCYDGDGNVVCLIAKLMLRAGRGWRELRLLDGDAGRSCHEGGQQNKSKRKGS